MKIFTCEDCGKNFKQQLDLEKHKNRRIPCSIKRKDKKFECDNCGKTYTRYNGLKEHAQTCKKENKKENKSESESENINININKNKNINLETNLKPNPEIEMIELKRKLLELEKVMLEMKKNEINIQNPNLNSNSNNTINNSINNTDNSINNSNFNNQNVFLANYTGTGMPPLSVDDIEPILKRGFQIPIELTRAIHFNPKYPEYHNIYLPKPDEKRAMVFKDGMWKSINRDDIIDDIYEHKRAYVVENLDKYKTKLNAAKQKSLQRWLDAEENDQSVLNTKKDLQYLLYDNRHIVIDRKKNYEKKQIKK
jgi:hypothetical protein